MSSNTDTMGEGTPGLMTSKWWPAICITAIVVWAAATLVAARVWPDDPDAPRYAFVVCGAVFFGFIFGYSFWAIRRSRVRAQSDLYERLALTPVTRGTVRRGARGMYRLIHVYLWFGVIVSGIGLGAVAVGDGEWQSRLLFISVGVVVLWLIYMFISFRTVIRSSDALFAPLGLRLVELPVRRISIFHDIVTLEGGVGYAGERHGREVSIFQTPKLAATWVGGARGDEWMPRMPVEMATFTGEPMRCWRGVTVEHTEEGEILVKRAGRDAGRWFLHDLLLAEMVAESGSTGD